MPTPPALALVHSAYAQGYERLRRHALEPGTPNDRQGLAVVARRGIASWLFVSAELPAPPPASLGQDGRQRLSGGVQTALIDILLAMVKRHMEGEVAA